MVKHWKVSKYYETIVAPRRDCLGYSKVYFNVKNRWFLAWNQNRHITYYIFHIQYTNSKISIGLLYIHRHFVCWYRLNHCVALVPSLPTYTLVRCLGKFVYIRQPFWRHYGLRTSNAADSRKFPFQISTLSCWHVLHAMAWSKLSNDIECS